MNRTIKKVAVLGSGVMGSRIACHFAGVGLQVLLLDITPKDVTTDAKPAERNKIVNDALNAAVKSNPSPVFHKDVVKKITTGNFDDNMKDIAHCDWIIEVVVERLDIKQKIFEQVEKYRKPGTLITSNTSGIPIHLMAEGRSDDFKKHFCGTHFFNPPRYLRLLEIIPTPFTDVAVVDFLMHYGDLYLGKTTVLCKDTPAFIANRVGVFGMMSIMNIKEKLKLSVDEIDALTGPIIGRPKSATFRTGDVVGLDTLVKVAKGVADNCPNDEAKDQFMIPEWLDKMIANNWLGDKTGQGFFKKTKGAGGEKEILTLNLDTLEYAPRVKPKFATLETAKPIEDLYSRLKMLVAGQDKAGEFYRLFHYGLFSYISHRIPEISDELYRVDDAMMAGFGWEIGAFETWDVLGVERMTKAMKEAGYKVAPWVDEMIASGNKTFYKVEGGKKYCYEPNSKTYKPLPGGEAFIVMSNYSGKEVWKNGSCQLYDLGDDVLGLQWFTKMGSIGGDVLSGINTAIEKAEKNYKGLVIANEGPNFSAGANVGMIFMLAIDQEYDELDMAIRLFQNTMMRARYSSVPVIVAPHGLALGGACELSLHADKCCAAAETYTGLVELGVGLIPGGGGTKEFALRASDEMHIDEPETITLKNRFLTIATAKVATSAYEGFDIGVYRKGLDEVVLNQGRRIAEAKKSVIEFFDSGYVAPVQRKDVKVLGRSALGTLYSGIHGMKTANYATEHDALVAKKLAFVMCGGDLSEPSLVSEQYLLDLERESFLSLCGEKKTLERIQSVLKSGRPIRN
ncbi:MAG TPA: 3-hydroxyacyl-CoA dehydrogenase NAD-binding domain-containing protein [Chitinophagaceae bacterium]|jgi:3-hydroxyacyl-CoA dehydrogenase|nr:3-hydroxyacyl-CoA dehydrogenase NAD-binding domain-containing protein [Chitinophagaceae bacterium]HMX76711.1 3-hydroxyacyl-CoA dehydrogenase NAD-binding domain-containing protein [Chitinophagaceae bacterium]HNA90896.1 3-hydroxyacyl-CoA dehydrogenase NAD-binding domain-containing protein [Chitinophagaceae bacterium]HNC37737.1 3-hydroxyacyl-CoA dehydrogenase NAD-binding domain-containing protein [Chitinophagaceae bacterium]HND94501.1 3-hydroxyacyl-CoA dehydrogenase NAD-binding domain-containin